MSKRKKKPVVEWSTFDETSLAELQGIVGQINSARFSLELLCSRWQKIPDDEAEQAVEQLREAHDALGEIFEQLEEVQTAAVRVNRRRS